MSVYRVGSAFFDPDACEIKVAGHLEHMQPLVRNVFLSLLRHNGQVVSREMLIAEAWPNGRGGDEGLTRCISILRRHLADRGDHHLIETIPKVGYRLHGNVSLDSGTTDSSPDTVSSPPYSQTEQVIDTQNRSDKPWHYFLLGAGTSLAAIVLTLMIISSS